jgi:hypothetical protein
MSSSWERRWPPFLGGSPSGGGGCGSKLDDAGTAKTRVARRPDRRTYGGGGIESTQSAWGERARVVVGPLPLARGSRWEPGRRACGCAGSRSDNKVGLAGTRWVEK